MGRIRSWALRAMVLALIFAAMELLPSSAEAQLDILVYDENSNNSYAVSAANNLSANVTVGSLANFNTLLTSQPWDLVLVDSPSTVPAGGWAAVISRVNSGACVVMSFWDWDNSNLQGHPQLSSAFGFTSVTSIVLVDEDTTISPAAKAAGNFVFTGVPNVPHDDWTNMWSDDGDVFIFNGATAIAELTASMGPEGPVIIQNPLGNGIAAFVIDEWAGAGAVELWEGLARQCRAVMPPVGAPALGPFGFVLSGLVLAAVAHVALRRRFGSVGEAVEFNPAE